MIYSLSKIAQITKGVLVGNDTKIKNLMYDSRIIFNSEQNLFFALKSAFNDGHNYINDLYQKGQKNFVVNNYFNDFKNYPKACFIVVNNTITALQQLASYHRQNFDITVFGITGSNGKTIVKEWLTYFLNKQENGLQSPKSYNSQIGVPLSVWELNKNHNVAVFEAGISKPDEMTSLQKIILPKIGILTNIGDAHQVNFKSIKQKIEEKLKLFSDSEILIYSPDFKQIKNTINEKLPNLKTFSWSREQKADLQILKIIKYSKTTNIELVYKSKIYQITTVFSDKASIENIMSVLSGLLIYYPLKNPNDFNFLELSPIEMRLQQIQGKNNCTIINDSYNSDLTSLKIAIDVLNTQNQNSKRTLFLSDIYQIGKTEKELYHELSKLLNNSSINKLIGVGENISKYQNLFSVEKYFFDSTNELTKNLNRFEFIDEAILLKGARKFHFENISDILQLKNHRTVLEIDMTALDHNLKHFREKLNHNTKIMIMVKAFSYGSGSFEIANFLQKKNIDYLAVAIADEGIELRKAGISLPILILNPDTANFNIFVENKLEPEIYNFKMLYDFYNAVKNKTSNAYPVHIKVNTGMNRLGFSKNQIPELLKILKKSSKIYVKSVFSHLVGSGDEQFDKFTIKQVTDYNSIVYDMENNLGYLFLKHILNSAGIERFNEYQFDMVRLGIGLYGISSVNNSNLQNISTLKTKIIQIIKVKANETIGYNRAAKVKVDSDIATIPIGYADGLNRLLSNGVGKVRVNDKIAPIIGNICMDLTMIDITGIKAKEGDEVIIFDEKNSIVELAKLQNTIPYEILTSISQRVKRVYVWE
ncbi:MAG: bifunctional UDP-N-acetylmuramoyl-tripeptide:D-alanyl-D-alanine ligase/alanine racemase [Bacteroidales bacterium]|nr:bifunctional UDP-N-acetylmuramoyl-tripeptide:D-alanyl-D-alanine ligase/alanine racemase [Bacteroidales bacterium]